MFSYLRPHRRTPSNPTSPVPDQTHSGESPLHHTIEHAHPFAPRTQDVNIPLTRPQNAAPSLPPIPRVSSYKPTTTDNRDNSRDESSEQGRRAYQWPPAVNTQVSEGDYQQWTQRQAQPTQEISHNQGGFQLTSPQNTRLLPGSPSEDVTRRRPSAGALPFVTAADIQLNYVPTGRRPAGARMPTPPPAPVVPVVSTFEASQPRSGKARLNLLNPMSLLARRRTAHAVQQSYPVPTIPQVQPPKNFEPIRGTKVHDFSAPRARRNVSYTDVQALDVDTGNSRYQRSSNGYTIGKGGEDQDLSPWSGGCHTPVFKEDFEEQQYPAAGPHVRKASDFSDLHMPRPAYAKGAQPSIEQALEARSLEPNTLSSPNITRKPSWRREIAEQGPPVPSKDNIPVGQLRPAPTEKRISITTPDKPPSSVKTSSRNVSAASANDAPRVHLPKHMKSTSSRFSFDMIGATSQEKILEDRHRKKALEKQSASPEIFPDEDEDENEDHRDFGEDNYDYDNMGDDDDLEERIPGVNADLEEDDDYEEEIPGQGEGMGRFTFHSLNISVNTSPSTPAAKLDTPRDLNGDAIGFAMTKEHPNGDNPDSPQPTPKLGAPDTQSQDRESVQTSQSEHAGLGLQGVDLGEQSFVYPNALDSSTISRLWEGNKKPHDDDDLYFDDGLIDNLGEGVDGVEFDESVFDNEDTDEYGRPIRPLSSLPTLYSPPLLQPDMNKYESVDQDNNKEINSVSHSQLDRLADISPKSQEKGVGTAPKQFTVHPSQLQPAPSLTHDTLTAYQSALAAAAHNAAAHGRFRRDSTPVHFEDPDSYTEPPATQLVPDFEDDYNEDDYNDDFDYDDALEDDAIIAEANAEALANDCDGFYGQEFGFYSAPAAGEAQYANGGFFGPRGADALTRSQSGRAAGREPNLTPITERSEYSNRNSVMSMALSYGPNSASLTSPGLAQLAGMMSEHGEDNMSLDALLKLRRGAWGGSQASIRSSDNGGASPLSALPNDESFTSPLSQPLWTQSSASAHRRHNSNFSVNSGHGSDASSSPASPTLTFSRPPQLQPQASSTSQSPSPTNSNPTAPPAPPSTLLASLNQRSPTSPTMRLGSAFGLVSPTNESFDKDNSFVPRNTELKQHRHTGSSDSISYMKENDPVTGERWVVERRRTGEGGEVEILGREVILGGRI